MDKYVKLKKGVIVILFNILIIFILMYFSIFLCFIFDELYCSFFYFGII